MNHRTRRNALILLVFTMAAILLFGAGLPSLHLNPGMPFPSGDSQPQAVNPTNPGESESNPVLLKGLIGFVGILLIIYLLYHLATGLRSWKKTLRLLSLPILLFLLLSLIPNALPKTQALIAEDGGIQPLPSFRYRTSPLGSPPPALIWLVVVGVIVLAVGTVAYLAWQSAKNSPPKDRVLQEAQSALAALHSGQDWRNVVLHCYAQMSQVLQEEQGIERYQGMTPRQFEQVLVARGIPDRPVRELTRLFEKVRYGHQPTSEPDEQAALCSLTEIAQYCQGKAMASS